MQPPAVPDCDDLERIVEIRNEQGLHMRPAMEFVDCANRFEARITICKDNQCVDGKSIMQVAMLAATKGTKLTIRAVGSDAHPAIETLAELFEKSNAY